MDRCDGMLDCNDGSDEDDCGKDAYIHSPELNDEMNINHHWMISLSIFDYLWQGSDIILYKHIRDCIVIYVQNTNRFRFQKYIIFEFKRSNHISFIASCYLVRNKNC